MAAKQNNIEEKKRCHHDTKTFVVCPVYLERMHFQSVLFMILWINIVTGG